MQFDDHGQISAEFVMIIGVGIIVSLSIAHTAVEAMELNTFMAAARDGALEGCMMDSMAFYPSEKFKFYKEMHPRLKTCSKLVVVDIKWFNMGFDTQYQKTKIMIKIYASSSSHLNHGDRVCEGDRINYYVRKNICKAFKTENISNVYCNPAFSDRYVFTCCDVEWI